MDPDAITEVIPRISLAATAPMPAALVPGPVTPPPWVLDDDPVELPPARWWKLPLCWVLGHNPWNGDGKCADCGRPIRRWRR